jgi:glycine dehydrogenase subunit 1
MLKYLGMKSAKELFDFIPEEILDPSIDLPPGLNERQLKESLEKTAGLNRSLDSFSSFLGGGAYEHYIPAAVSHITLMSQFATAYTPYQAEISQGTLQYIFEFQSLICRLTGMDVSNASMYDGASSLAEAILLASRVNGKNRVILAHTIDPQYRETVKTYVYGLGIEIFEAGMKDGITDVESLKNILDEKTSAVAVQMPNFFGCFEDVYSLRNIMNSYPDCLYIICANPVSLALLKPPSEYGADIAVGDAQVFGNPLSFGGPYLGYFAAKEKYLRQVPGRIVGKTVDRDGKDAFVLTYQAREQHIRKTKATSNICTNHSLNVLAAAVYLALLGEEGLKDAAGTCLQRADYFAKRLKETGHFWKKYKSRFFNELVISTDLHTDKVLKRLYREKILGGMKLGRFYPGLSDSILVSFTEMNSTDDIDKYIDILKRL